MPGRNLPSAPRQSRTTEPSTRSQTLVPLVPVPEPPCAGDSRQGLVSTGVGAPAVASPQPRSMIRCRHPEIALDADTVSGAQRGIVSVRTRWSSFLPIVSPYVSRDLGTAEKELKVWMPAAPETLQLRAGVCAPQRGNQNLSAVSLALGELTASVHRGADSY
jgi:hypothetical protein